MTDLQLSPHAVATLVVRLTARRLPSVALAARPHERQLARLFMHEVRRAQAAIPMDELEEALKMPGTGSPLWTLQPVFDLLLEETHLTQPLEPYLRTMGGFGRLMAEKPRIVDVLSAAMKAGARAGAKAAARAVVKKKLKLPMTFDMTNPAAVEWAERHAAELVTNVTSGARDTIRTVVVEGFENGVPVRETAKLIRASIGLTARDADAVMRQQVELMGQGLDLDTIVARGERYAEKLTRGRAKTIARTETMRASNEGQAQLWDQAIESGLLTGDEQKVWITADPCPLCAELEGETVGLDEDFSIGSNPPAHVNCRCVMGLVA